MPIAIVTIDSDAHAEQLEQMLEAWLAARHPAHGAIDVRVEREPVVYSAESAAGADDLHLFDSEQARDLFVMLKDWAEPATDSAPLLDMDFVRSEAASMLAETQVGELLAERGVGFEDMPPDVAIDTIEWWQEVATLGQAELDAALDDQATRLIDLGYDVQRSEARRQRRLDVVRAEAWDRLSLFETGDPATGRHWINAQVRDAFGAVRGQVRRQDERLGWLGVLSLEDDLVAAVAMAALNEAVADPDFAIKLDWARRYENTNPEAAEYLAAHEGEI